MINRRFVPIAFDLNTQAPLGDADARAFVLAKRKDLAGMSVNTPKVMVMTPGGKLVAEIDN